MKQEVITEVGSQIQEYQAQSNSNGSFQARRHSQELYWLHQTIEDRLKSEFYNRPGIEKHLKNLEQQILDKKITAFEAADILMNQN